MKQNLVPIVLFLVLGFIGWVVIASIRRIVVARQQAHIQTILLARFSTPESFMAYAETAAGKQFMDSLVADRETYNSPYRSIISGTQGAIVLIVFGLTLLFLHHTGVTPADAVIVFGAIAIALGVGFGLAAGATYFLSDKFGLLNKEHS
jgi:hypothetical protein